MAIYHLEAKVVSRGNGRSAVAASAYLSCSKILNDYDGVQHDFTRKKGLIWQDVFLPEFAPSDWKDRSVLWNAVEKNEKTKDSRLAREFVPALPIELTPSQWQELLTDFIQNNFVADGMCADVAVHDPYPPGHNPHAHIMVTVRPLDEKGNWQYKAEKEYVCVRNGEERGFTAAEFKAAQADGWEKQYPYKVGRKKVYLPSSEAEKHGYERVSKYPKSTKYGRQNPISERWNSEEQLVQWCKAWADAANRYLERYGHEERIDHRSHAERGLDEQPTIHEGVFARSLERQGVISDRCEINRQIKADNALLHELKAAVRKLAQAVKNTIPALAEAMERLRGNMIIFRYQLRHIGMGKHRMNEHIQAAIPTQAFPSQNQECLLEGMKRIFEHIGGVPPRLRFDNMTTAVAQVLKDGERVLTDGFTRFMLHYRFQADFCNPASGNEKGNVENKVGYSRRNAFVPVPVITSFEEFNEQLLEWCEKDADRLHYKHKVPIRELWEEDKAALLELPQYPFSVFRYTTLTVSKTGFATIETNKYGLSPMLAGEKVQAKIFYDHVEFYHDHRPVGRFPRSYKTNDEVYDWTQYVSTLCKKPGAIEHTRFFHQMPQRWQDYLASTKGKERKSALQLLSEIVADGNSKFCDDALEMAAANGRADVDSLRQCYYMIAKKEYRPDPLKLSGAPLLNYNPNLSAYDDLMGGEAHG